MDASSIKELIKTINGPNAVIETDSRWVTTTCPLAYWTHAGGKDSRPSFGISIHDGETSIARCFTCKHEGPLTYLLKRLESFTGDDYSDLISGTETEEFLGGDLPEWGSKASSEYATPPLGDPLNKDEVMSVFRPAAGHPYLERRGISGVTARNLELVYDVDSHGHRRILFPVFDPQGGLHGFSGRAIKDGVHPKVRDYFGLKKARLLLGSHLIAGDCEYVVLVEGLFDYAKMYQYGLPVVASMHSSITEYQADILKDIRLPVYCMLDNDKAGREGRARVNELLSLHVPVMEVRYPAKHVKDPDGLYEEEAFHMLAEARLI